MMSCTGGADAGGDIRSTSYAEKLLLRVYSATGALCKFGQPHVVGQSDFHSSRQRDRDGLSIVGLLDVIIHLGF